MRMRALVIRIIRQFKRDKRSLALMFLAPILILTLMSFVFNGASYVPKLAIGGEVPEMMEKAFIEQGAEVSRATAPEAEALLRSGEIDAFIEAQNGQIELLLEGSDPSVSRSVLLLLQESMKGLSPEGMKPNVAYLHGAADMSAFDNFGPVLVGFFSFFFVFLLSGVAFLRERTGGTLERLLATPMKRYEIVFGYLIGFGLFAIFQSVLIAWYAIHVLDMMMAGSFWLVLLVTLMLAMTALTLGTLLSAYASNEFQMVQFIPLIVVPQVFFSGLFNMETMAEWLRWLSWIMPLTYAADALRGVMIRGVGWADIALDLGVLSAFSIAFAAANIAALRKYRKV